MGAAFLGVGSMVGAGIFALLGEAGAVAGAAVWLSFLLGGTVATLLGYVTAKLGARYPSSGGVVTFLIEGFGTNSKQPPRILIASVTWSGWRGPAERLRDSDPSAEHPIRWMPAKAGSTMIVGAARVR